MHIGITDDNKQIAVHNLQKQSNLLIDLYYQHNFILQPKTSSQEMHHMQNNAIICKVITFWRKDFQNIKVNN